MKKDFNTFFILTGILFSLSSGLFATEPFWSTLPSTQTIERHDSLTGFDITHYGLWLNVNDQTHYVSGEVVANVTAESNLTAIDYNLMGGTLNPLIVSVNTLEVPYTFENGIIHIPLNISTGQQFTTEIAYSGSTGLSPTPYNIGLKYNANSIYTLSNPDAGRYWWPSYDHPWDKATIDMHITVRSDWNVACIGTRQSITDNGDGTRTHNWSLASQVATYVVGFAAGPLVEFSQQAGPVPIQNFVLQTQLANAQYDFANVPEMINYFSTIYGPYPFEKYGQVAVTISPYAAMEHQTMTTFGAQYVTGTRVNEPTVAHELTHQWYGNSVTPLTMQDVWLKESFATYSEFLWKAYKYGWTTGLDYLSTSIQQYYLTWETSNGPHTIYNPVYNELFAPPTYEKSASVLHMLRLKMGNTLFYQFMQTWYNTHQNGNVITAEIRDTAEQVSGMDLTQFFNQWIYHAGIPSANLTVFTNGANSIKVFAQTTSNTATQFDLEIPLMLPGSALLDSLVVNATPAGQYSYHAYDSQLDNPSNLQIDPHHWVLNRGYTDPRMVLNSCSPADNSVSLSWSAFSSPAPIIGYNVWRRLVPSQGWTCVNPEPVTVLSFTDNTALNGNTYEYIVQAVDSEGYESLPSNAIQASPFAFPFDLGFLVVDETRDGTGITLSPSDQQVDDFYAAALAGFARTDWDCVTQGLPTLQTLSRYPLVLWHCDDFTDFLVDDDIDNLNSYVHAGGKLLISGWKYPSVLLQSFWAEWFPVLDLQLLNTASLEAAESSVYPTLHPDPAKIPSGWYGKLPMIYLFNGATDVLYTADLADSIAGNGAPLGVRAVNNGTLVLLGFPLYYMQAAEADAFLQQILPELYPPVAVDDLTHAPAASSFVCYPNPFMDQVSLHFNSRAGAPLRVEIFNVKGQKVSELTADPDQDLVFSGRDKDNKPLVNGIYLIRVTGRSGSTSHKVTLIRR